MAARENEPSSAGAVTAEPARKQTSLFKRILLGLAVIAIAFVIIVAVQPSDFRITRTAKISAPAATVFEQVNDFRNWNAWSPWAKLDPEMKHTYEGASEGKGAVYTWAGNDDVEEGRMTIVESRPPEVVVLNLEFLKPFAATNVTEFSFVPEGDQTNVSWSMYGKRNFMMKAMCLFMDMDKMVGGDFEKGLVSMKSIVEAAPAPPDTDEQG